MADNTKSGRVFSLGSINADFQVRIERRPDVSETLVGQEFARFAGGKASNVAYLAQRLGVPARLFGHVGDDDLAEQALGALRDCGVDLSCVKRLAGEATGVALITVPPDGKKGIVLAPNAGSVWNEADVDELVSAIADAPDRTLVALDCEVPVFVVEAVALAAKDRGLQVVLDPSPADQVSDKLIAAASFITPNPSEAKQITGIEVTDRQSAAKAGRAFIERGAGAACMKLPDGGCVLVEKERVSFISTAPVEVVDTTGGGDAFTGGLAAALSEGQSALDATRFAVACSHLTVAEYGSKVAGLDRAAIERMLGQLKTETDE